MNLENRVRTLVLEKLADRSDLFIVSIKITNNANVVVLLDGDKGLGIHDCAMISRHVGHCLEEENAVSDAYTLEVSSAGVGSPLVLQRQFIKNIERSLIIKLISGEKLEGVLMTVTTDNIMLNIIKKEKGKKLSSEIITIANANISEAIVQISFK